MTKFKSDDDIFVLFAHANYQLDIGFKKLNPQQKSFQVYNYDDLMANIEKANVLVISGLWQNELIDKVLIGMLANGHMLLEGVPGLAKTLTLAHEKYFGGSVKNLRKTHFCNKTFHENL